MRVRWTVLAADDLASIKSYPQKHYPQFAEPTVRTIYELIRSLEDLTLPGQTRTPQRHKRAAAYTASLARISHTE